ncbi:MAG: alpha/beta hydrolase [Rhodobacteraceae bacterium]|nr:alpha/beta hydrolase [Paracoccaceae bacterium]
MPHFTSADGLRLYYSDEGAGLPLLCLPGLTRTSGDFDYVLPHLRGCRILRTDYRGRGRSEWAPDPATYALPVETADVLALLDHLGLEQVAVLGTSRGGLIAMAMAAAAPGRILGVALNDVGPVLEMAYLKVIVGLLGQRPVWRNHREAAQGLPMVMAGFANVPEDRWLAEARLHFRETHDGLDLTYDPALREATAIDENAPAPDLWPLFDALAAKPLAAIRGANSPLLSPATLADMRARRPDMIVAEVPDRGHVPFLDEPQSLTALHAWLEMLQ